MINVFWWPAAGGGELAAAASTTNGYHIIHARHNGEESWIVSDLNLPELENFARVLIPSR